MYEDVLQLFQDVCDDCSNSDVTFTCYSSESRPVFEITAEAGSLDLGSLMVDFDEDKLSKGDSTIIRYYLESATLSGQRDIDKYSKAIPQFLELSDILFVEYQRTFAR